MKLPDFLWLGMLLVGALLIWLGDLAWVSGASETLPVLVALPLFVWLGAPWRFRSGPFQLPGRSLAAAGVLLGLGCVLNFTFLLAAAWTLALWSWLRLRVISGHAGWGRLILLPLMAFPWLRLDFSPVGWWFRLSAAWVAEHLFGALGFSVLREGTTLLVHGLPVEVAAACSGMNSLQALLIAGIVLAWIELRGSRWFWPALATLPALAWTANVLRICSTVVLALSWGSGVADSWLHGAGGWGVLMLVFLCWWLILGASRRLASHAPRITHYASRFRHHVSRFTHPASPPSSSKPPRLPSAFHPEWGVLAFCAWHSSDLLTAWQYSPFDRLGWLALALWVTPTLAGALGLLPMNLGNIQPPTPNAQHPMMAQTRGPGSKAPCLHSAFCILHSALQPLPPSQPTRRGLPLAWLGLLTCLAGMLTDLHVLNYVALALACAAVTPCFPFRGLWLVLALAWMPVLGWLLGSLSGSGVALIRLGLAVLAAAIGFAHPLVLSAARVKPR